MSMYRQVFGILSLAVALFFFIRALSTKGQEQIKNLVSSNLSLTTGVLFLC